MTDAAALMVKNQCGCEETQNSTYPNTHPQSTFSLSQTHAHKYYNPTPNQCLREHGGNSLPPGGQTTATRSLFIVPLPSSSTSSSSSELMTMVPKRECMVPWRSTMVPATEPAARMVPVSPVPDRTIVPWSTSSSSWGHHKTTKPA